MNVFWLPGVWYYIHRKGLSYQWERQGTYDYKTLSYRSRTLFSSKQTQTRHHVTESHPPLISRHRTRNRSPHQPTTPTATPTHPPLSFRFSPRSLSLTSPTSRRITASYLCGVCNLAPSALVSEDLQLHPSLLLFTPRQCRLKILAVLREALGSATKPA